MFGFLRSVRLQRKVHLCFRPSAYSFAPRVGGLSLQPRRPLAHLFRTLTEGHNRDTADRARPNLFGTNPFCLNGRLNELIRGMT